MIGKYWSKFLLLCMLISAGVNGAPDTDPHTSYTELKQDTIVQHDFGAVTDLVFPPQVEDKYLVVPDGARETDQYTGNEDWDNRWVMSFRLTYSSWSKSFRCCLRNICQQRYQAECVVKTGISLEEEEQRLWLKFPKAEPGELAQRMSVDRFSVSSEECPGLVPLGEEIAAMMIPVFLPNYIGSGAESYEFDFPVSTGLHLHFTLVAHVDDPLTGWARTASVTTAKTKAAPSRPSD